MYVKNKAFSVSTIAYDDLTFREPHQYAFENITHKTLENNYKNLLINLAKNKFVLSKPTFIRVEKI